MSEFWGEKTEGDAIAMGLVWGGDNIARIQDIATGQKYHFKIVPGPATPIPFEMLAD